MRFSRWMVFGLAVCFANGALAQSALVRTVEYDLTNECSDPKASSFVVCVEALRLHGIGKDDLALETLNRGTEPSAAGRYKIAIQWPKDQFWMAVATAGAKESDCRRKLPKILDAHFLYDADAVAAANNDYSKSAYTALYDLIQAIPNCGFPSAGQPVVVDAVPREIAVNAYRFCFKDSDQLFSDVKSELKPRSK